MFRYSGKPLYTIGFYIVLHTWLVRNGLVKVGYSTNVEQRLETASYKTCFTPEWYFFRVFECESELDALILEQSVLYCMAAKRVPRRELLHCTAEEVAKIATEVSQALHINTIVHTNFKNTFSYKKQKIPKDQVGNIDKHNDLIEEDVDNEGYQDFTNSDFVNQRNSIKSGNNISSQKKNEKNPHNESEKESNDDENVAQAITPYLGVLDTLSLKMSTERLSVSGMNTDTGNSLVESDVDVINTLSDSDDFHLICEETYHLASLRPYQQEAVRRLRFELMKSGRAICQMACRCGKTPVAYQLVKEYLFNENKKNIVLYLVPGLALLRQTAQKLYQYGLGDMDVKFLLIGSHPEPVFCGSSSLHMTTDPLVIESATSSAHRLLIVSTYHSSALLSDIHQLCTLVVFDECHRVCGSAESTSFNRILKLPKVGDRLFLTATPTYDTPIKMSDESIFGGVGYRYYLREGIDAGYVNPFGVRVILGETLNDMNPFLLEAMKLVNKLLVFCRDIEHAEKLYHDLVKEGDSPSETGVAPFHCFVAHSRLGNGVVSGTLQRFMASQRAVLFNVRLFQEGVEIPDLNAVFFATPRYSSRDIVQSICRPLNKMEGKPLSYVFLPAVIDTTSPEEDPINLENFSTLVPFTDALMDEDPSLFEYMIDPQNKSYNFSVVGVRSLPLTSDRIQQFVLPAIRRGVRYSTRNTDRLSRVQRLPWKYVFAELHRVVSECNRYPKTNDAWVVGSTSLPLNRFYYFCRRGYYLYEKKQPTYLKVHQLRDLESLPEWRRYGVNGPYPWNECLATLRRLLEAYGSCPPLDVHKGGYIGLDATPLERLCGCLMHINQCDAKDQLRLSLPKQKALDQLCSAFGLCWRKGRDAAGAVVPPGKPGSTTTFITQSYNAFKWLFAHRHHVPSFQLYLDQHFPGYPEKHLRMERLDVLQRGSPPPRYNPASVTAGGVGGAAGRLGVQTSTPVGRGTSTMTFPFNREGVRREMTDATTTANKKSGKKSIRTEESTVSALPDAATLISATPRLRKNKRRNKKQTSMGSTGGDSTRTSLHVTTAPGERAVMCRVCRAHIPVKDWEQHLLSRAHLQMVSSVMRESR